MSVGDGGAESWRGRLGEGVGSPGQGWGGGGGGGATLLGDVLV